MNSELINEEWRIVIIEGKKTNYFISNMGRLKSNFFGKEKRMQSSSKNNNYVTCSLRLNRTTYYPTRVHRLVAEAFIPNPDNLPQINHINCIKHDNRVENLEWCTSQHNIRHSFDNKLVIRPKGKDSHLYDKGREIIDLNTGFVYSSVAEAARSLHIPRTTISAEINGHRPKKLNIIPV